jgi:hypothetical protein
MLDREVEDRDKAVALYEDLTTSGEWTPPPPGSGIAIFPGAPLRPFTDAVAHELMKRVAVAGSFNPPHNLHLEMVRAACTVEVNPRGPPQQGAMGRAHEPMAPSAAPPAMVLASCNPGPGGRAWMRCGWT